MAEEHLNHMKNPPVMILCGGLGSRLHEETEFRPKPMLEIGEKPILWHIMKLYAHYGFKEFILCLGYKGNAIKNFFLNYRAYQSDFTVHLGNSGSYQFHPTTEQEDWQVTLVETGQTTQTGGRVAQAGRYIKSDDFCLTYGDGLGNIDLKQLLQFHRQHGKIGTVTGVRPPGRFGELEINGSGQAAEFKEKPQVAGGIINGGFFVFKRNFLDQYLKDETDLVLEQAPLQTLAKEGELMVHPHEGFWQPMDTYREYKLLNNLWAQGEAPWKVWS
jgi:glucose-1-phosphate cytidylyltransferase